MQYLFESIFANINIYGIIEVVPVHFTLYISLSLILQVIPFSYWTQFLFYKNKLSTNY